MRGRGNLKITTATIKRWEAKDPLDLMTAKTNDDHVANRILKQARRADYIADNIKGTHQARC